MLLVFLPFVIACNSTTPAAPPSAESSNTFCNDKQALEGCIDQPVKIIGVESTIPNQHPLMNGPNEHQQYIDTEQGQIVILTSEEISCPAEIEITGPLDLVALDCEEGESGKCSYQNYFVTVEKWECK